MMGSLKTVLVIGVIWQIASMAIGNSLILPGIVDVISTLFRLLGDRDFLSSIMASILLLFKSWVIVLAIMLLLLLLASLNRHIREIIKTLSLCLQPTPTFAWLPVFMLLFGVNETTVIIMLVFSGIWFLGLNYIVSLETSMTAWKKHCDNLDLGVLRSMILVYLPSMKDTLMASSKTAWNISWRTLLALEVVFGSIGKHWGLGTYMITVKDRMDITEMYAALFVIILIGIVFNILFEWMLNNKGKNYVA